MAEQLVTISVIQPDPSERRLDLFLALCLQPAAKTDVSVGASLAAAGLQWCNRQEEDDYTALCDVIEGCGVFFSEPF